MNYIKEILKGILIGVANVIPGVSGGTLAVSMGIYDKIIGSITHIFKDTKKSVVVLFPYGIGAAIGIVGLSFMIEFLFENYPLQTSLTFIGLITGGLPVIFGKVKGKPIKVTGAAAFLLMFIVVVGMAVMGNGTEKLVDLKFGLVPSIQLFFVGMVAAATMVIPGVSGSMLLMLLGYYQPIIGSINQFIRSVVSFDISGVLAECGILIPFGIGVGAGIFACAKLIELLLKKYQTTTYCAILGLVISSPIVILWGIPIVSINLLMVVSGLVCFALAFTGAAWLSKTGEE